LQHLSANYFRKFWSVFEVKVSKSIVGNYIGGFNYSLKRTSIIPERRNSDHVIETSHVFAN
jgi:hypothetical protein